MKAELIAGALLVVIAAFFYGQFIGAQSAKAQYLQALNKAQTETIRAAELASRKEASRLAAETARADMVLQLEEAARAEIPTNSSCLPVSRVLRLNQR